MRGDRKSMVLVREVIGLSEDGCYEFIRRVIEGSSFVGELVREVVVDYGEAIYGFKRFRDGKLVSNVELSGYNESVVRKISRGGDGADGDLVNDALRVDQLVSRVMIAVHLFSRYVSYMNVVRYLSGRHKEFGEVYVLDH